MKKIVLFIWLMATSSLLAAEPSAYGAGDLESDTPYGLTSGEKQILKNKETLSTLEQSVSTIKQQISTLNERYEGLRSVTEAFGSKIAKIDGKIRELQKSDEAFDEYEKEIADIKNYMNESRELQDQNQAKIKVVLEELSSIIDSINNSYVSKKEFNELKDKIDSLSQEQQKDDLSSKSGAQLLKEGVELFENKSYGKAKQRFEMLIEKHYKPAQSNYYLGEIAYARESYRTAIEHYKTSIGLYDEAEYIPRLLYHTGISFSKLGDSTQAKEFFTALKQGYPDSKEAKSLK